MHVFRTWFSEFSINFARGVLENDISAMAKLHLASALFAQLRAGKCGEGSPRRAPGPETRVGKRFFWLNRRPRQRRDAASTMCDLISCHVGNR